ncbi:MAG: hypothetical protein HY744_16795 [Deltaproteobacteria bacterium]|nr:hypothetical protein [Deltaproteobacteria bacterium]
MANAAKVRKLKNCLNALDKLKVIRSELKAKLSREDLDPDKEKEVAGDLKTISGAIVKLERRKIKLARAT